MTPTRKQIIAGIRKMHNHIGFWGDLELCRLIGFHEDEHDYYYHVRRSGNRKDRYLSYVGAFITLKGALSDEDYASVDNTMTLNRAGPSKKFLITSESK